jgi:hypothetical protein
MNLSRAIIRDNDGALEETLIITIGGFIEIDVKELTVIPTSLSSCLVVTIETGCATRRMNFLSCGSNTLSLSDTFTLDSTFS